MSGLSVLAEVKKTDPADGQFLTLSQLREKMEAYFTEDDIVQYWKDTCQDFSLRPALSVAFRS